MLTSTSKTDKKKHPQQRSPPTKRFLHKKIAPQKDYFTKRSPSKKDKGPPSKKGPPPKEYPFFQKKESTPLLKKSWALSIEITFITFIYSILYTSKSKQNIMCWCTYYNMYFVVFNKKSKL